MQCDVDGGEEIDARNDATRLWLNLKCRMAIASGHSDKPAGGRLVTDKPMDCLSN